MSGKRGKPHRIACLSVRASLLAHDVLGALRALRGPRDGHEEDGVGGEDADVEEEQQEVLLVPLAHAVVDPGTVVVHLANAPLADAAVVRPRRPVHFASDQVHSELKLLITVFFWAN